MQNKIKDCDVFLQQHAARKETYLSEKYYEEQIMAVRDGKEKGYEQKILHLERMAAE